MNKAAKTVETGTHQGHVKRARNMDLHDLKDHLEGRLNNAVNEVGQALKLITALPNIKNARLLT